MGIKTSITNHHGIPWKVDLEGNGNVSVATHPPLDEKVIGLPFRKYFTNNGSNDMAVNGSLAAPVEFCVAADPIYDTWIKSVNIKLADAGAQFNEFGALPALANGVELLWSSQQIGEFVIHDGIKDNLEFFRLGGQTPNIVDISGAGSDAVIVQVDMFGIFSPPFGLRLRAGTTEKLVLNVRDNISGVDSFNVIAYGINVATGLE
jgi:hypothetical protein